MGISPDDFDGNVTQDSFRRGHDPGFGLKDSKVGIAELQLAFHDVEGIQD